MSTVQQQQGILKVQKQLKQVKDRRTVPQGIYRWLMEAVMMMMTTTKGRRPQQLIADLDDRFYTIYMESFQPDYYHGGQQEEIQHKKRYFDLFLYLLCTWQFSILCAPPIIDKDVTFSMERIERQYVNDEERGKTLHKDPRSLLRRGFQLGGSKSYTPWASSVNAIVGFYQGKLSTLFPSDPLVRDIYNTVYQRKSITTLYQQVEGQERYEQLFVIFVMIGCGIVLDAFIREKCTRLFPQYIRKVLQRVNTEWEDLLSNQTTGLSFVFKFILYKVFQVDFPQCPLNYEFILHRWQQSLGFCGSGQKQKRVQGGEDVPVIQQRAPQQQQVMKKTPSVQIVQRVPWLKTVLEYGPQGRRLGTQIGKTFSQGKLDDDAQRLSTIGQLMSELPWLEQ